MTSAFAELCVEKKFTCFTTNCSAEKCFFRNSPGKFMTYIRIEIVELCRSWSKTRTSKFDSFKFIASFFKYRLLKQTVPQKFSTKHFIEILRHFCQEPFLHTITAFTTTYNTGICIRRLVCFTNKAICYVGSLMRSIA
jgi:hypothetical protein